MAYQFPVNINLGGFGTLQKQIDGLPFPCGGNNHLVLIPRTPLVRKTACEMGGLVVLNGHVALFVRICRSWQLYRLRQHVIWLDGMLAVEGKLPGSAEVDTFGLADCCHVQAKHQE